MMGAVLGYQGTNFGKAQVVALANLYTMGMDEKVSSIKSSVLHCRTPWNMYDIQMHLAVSWGSIKHGLLNCTTLSCKCDAEKPA